MTELTLEERIVKLRQSIEASGKPDYDKAIALLRMYREFIEDARYESNAALASRLNEEARYVIMSNKGMLKEFFEIKTVSSLLGFYGVKSVQDIEGMAGSNRDYLLKTK